MKVWSDIGSTCKFRNARSAFRNLHVDPLSLHTFMRNKQVEFNPYIYTLTTLSKLCRFGYEISVFNTKHPVIILRVSLFAITPSHVASTKIECQNFSYVYRSRKHWECKYSILILSYPSMGIKTDYELAWQIRTQSHAPCKTSKALIPWNASYSRRIPFAARKTSYVVMQHWYWQDMRK